MEISLAFWVVFLICFVGAWWVGYPYAGGYGPFFPYLAIFLLLFLLGWRVFGFIIHG